MKLTGKRSAGNPHATFDEAEAGNVLKTLSGAPVFDPTDEGELEIEPFGNYASSLLYLLLHADSQLCLLSTFIVRYLGMISSNVNIL